MKLAAFQKYLRALSDAMGAEKSPGNDLLRAADALAPFADRMMEEFATFLALVAEKYQSTGELPDGQPPKPVKPPKAANPQAAQFKTRIEEIKLQLDRGEQMTRNQIETEVAKYEKLTQTELDSVMAGLQFPKMVKPKKKAMEAIVTHIFAARSATDRAKI